MENTTRDVIHAEIGQALLKYLLEHGAVKQTIYGSSPMATYAVPSYFLFDKDLSQTSAPLLTWSERNTSKNKNTETWFKVWAFFDYVVVQSETTWLRSGWWNKDVEMIFLPSSLKPGNEKVREFMKEAIGNVRRLSTNATV